MRTVTLFLSMTLGLSAASGARDSATHRYLSPWKTPWTYQGPRGSDHWAQLDPAYTACSGKAQSPIDIHDARVADLPPLRFDYHAAAIDYVTNNGAAIRVDYEAPGSGDFLMVGNTRYELTQFHFHRPSEETIDGKRFALVAHLMHRSSDGQVAGVAVLFKLGKANPLIGKLRPHMPKHEGEQKVSGLVIDPADLLPLKQGYYAYEGSQTAPPCHEGVKWFVLKTPMEASAAQVQALAEIYPHDVRRVQPLNGRMVQQTRDD